MDVYAVTPQETLRKLQSIAPALRGSRPHGIPIAFLGDGNTLAVGTETGTVDLYDQGNLSAAPVPKIRLPRLGRVSHIAVKIYPQTWFLKD